MIKREEEKNTVGSQIFKIASYAVLAFVVISIIFGAFYTIDAGEKGVLLTFGKADMDEKAEGLHFKIPLVQTVVIMEARTQKYEADASSASSDLQIVTAKIATNFHLTPGEVPSIYSKLGENYAERVIMPMEQEVVKATTAKYTAEELITKREEVRLEIKQVLTDRLRERGIIVEEVSITNFDFSQSFNDAIEAKVTAEQLKLKAGNDLERIKIEKEQTITKAQGDAEALKLQKQEVNDNLVKLKQIEVERMAIEKWDGHLPQVTGGAIPFVSLNTANGASSSFPSTPEERLAAAQTSN